MEYKSDGLDQLNLELSQLERDLQEHMEAPKKDQLTIDKYKHYIKKAKKRIAELLEEEPSLNAITESRKVVSKAALKRKLENVNYELGLLLSNPSNQEAKQRRALLKEMKRDLSSKLNFNSSVVSFKDINHPNKTLLEAHKINYLEITGFIYKFFKERLGIPVEIMYGQYEGELDIYVPRYAQHTNAEFKEIMKELKELDNYDSAYEPVSPSEAGPKVETTTDSVCKDLQKKLNKEFNTEVGIYATKSGYTLYVGSADDTGPISFTEATDKSEPINKDDLKNEVDESNIVLDSKFTWVFAVIDEYSESIIEDIYSIEEAIGYFVDNEPEAVMIVAYPYVDPNPEDPNAELVFADNPGPVIIYDTERATKPKPEKEKELTRQELDAIKNNKKGIKESRRTLMESGGTTEQHKTFYDIVLELSTAFNTLERDKFDGVVKQLVNNNQLEGVLKAIIELVKASDDLDVTQELNRLGGYIYSASRKIVNNSDKYAPNSLKSLVDKVKARG